MRLLLRANAHRRTDEGSIEIAASPDTPNRERWQWHIRLDEVEAGSTPEEQGVQLSCGDARQLRLQAATHAETVRAETEVHQVEQPLVIRRPATDVLVLLVHQGEALIEQRHRLTELDALVLEGDDPLEVIVEPTTAPTGLAVIRLRPVSDRPLAWVP
jgi:hypothetical protein